MSFSGALVSVTTSEYFTETKYIQMSQERQLNFELEPAVSISMGECVSLEVSISAGAAATLDVTVLRPNGTIGITAWVRRH